MTPEHKIVLYTALAFFGASLVLPGLVEMFKPQAGITGLLPETPDATSHWRGLNGMMVAVGLLALWACLDLQHARTLVLVLGFIILLVVASRLYSLLADGTPSLVTLIYLAAETLLALVFLFWPPPHSADL